MFGIKEILFVSVCLLLCIGCNGKSKKTAPSLSENSRSDVERKDIQKLDTAHLIEVERKKVLIEIQSDRTLEDYKRSIANFSESHGQKETKEIESIFPMNEDEFLYFYSLSYPEEYPESDLDLYYELDEIMLKYAIKDSGNCLFLYSNLAEFVDGEYADYFFDAIKEAIKPNVDKFCGLIYHSLSEISKERLVDVYEEFCKSLE